MDTPVFAVIIYIIVSMGMLSIAWIKKAMDRLTDPLIKDLFKNLIVLTIISIAFSMWVIISSTYAGEKDITSYQFVISISLVAIFAAISKGALSAKKISDVYGFKVDEQKKKNGD
jgi:hypothetical protein